MEDKFQLCSITITHSDFQEVSCDLRGIMLTALWNTVKTSIYINSLLPNYKSINITILPF